MIDMFILKRKFICSCGSFVWIYLWLLLLFLGKKNPFSFPSLCVWVTDCRRVSHMFYHLVRKCQFLITEIPPTHTCTHYPLLHTPACKHTHIPACDFGHTFEAIVKVVWFKCEGSQCRDRNSGPQTRNATQLYSLLLHQFSGLQHVITIFAFCISCCVHILK